MQSFSIQSIPITGKMLHYRRWGSWGSESFSEQMVTWGRARNQFFTRSLSPTPGTRPLGPHRAVAGGWDVEGQEGKASVMKMVTELQFLQPRGEGCKVQAGSLNSTHLPCLSNAYSQDTNDRKTSVKVYNNILTSPETYVHKHPQHTARAQRVTGIFHPAQLSPLRRH